MTNTQWAPQGLYPEGVDWNTKLEGGTLVTLLEQATRKYADQIALRHMGRKYTYRELGKLVDRAAKGLMAQGIKPGDRVGLFMPNTPYYPIMFFGALKAGATVVNYSGTYKGLPEKLAAQIADSGTETMITMDIKDFYSSTLSLIRDGTLKQAICCPMHGVLPLAKSIGFRLFKRDKVDQVANDNRIKSFKSLLNDGDRGDFTFPAFDENHLALLQYTGGTTGTPKGVMLSHFNLAANNQQIAAMTLATPNRPADKSLIRPGQEKFLSVLPPFHVYGMMIAMINAIGAGAEISILPDPRNLKDVLSTIQREKITVFPLVPQMATALTNYPDLKKYDISSVRVVPSGGAAMAPAVRIAFESATGSKVFQGYGLSETSPVVCGNPPGGVNKPDSVGVPYPGTEIRIISLQEEGKVLSHNGSIACEDGEICVRGSQVMKGYYQKPDETAECLSADGWFRTGDVGHFDEDGYLFITDRLKRMANINGMKVYPNMIEKKIAEHPAVAECVVIRLDKGKPKESLRALIRYRTDVPAPDKAELRAFMEEHLSRFDIPRSVEIRTTELPKTAAFKPDWNALEVEAAKAKIARSPQP